MRRFVNKALLEERLSKLAPQALEKWAVQAKLSSYVLVRVRGGQVPPKDSTRIKAAEGLGVTEDDLFPPKVATAKTA